MLVKNKAVFKRQKPASFMVWAGLTTCGRKTPLIFIPEGVKINQKVYLDMMSMQVLPWIKKQEWRIRIASSKMAHHLIQQN
ncbi:Putative LOC100197594 [Caligus rogercresseyi]|uniref:LOC100197594 n=1 Tax=Caligus rogercresseyi TaxID=217165 RepID=A0A7T8JZG1_CALRO|nr:Putative LOC100197594 [Caligus rogercresseyi]